MRAGRHAAAAELLAHCEARAPWTLGIAALRAQAALLAGDAAEAERLARAALARGGVDGAVHSVLAHALVTQDRLAEAGPHFAAAARLAPDSPYLAHLAAASGGTAPDRAPEGYVAALFDGYAPHFEAALLGLGYRVPGLIRRAVERLLPAVAAGGAPLGPVLDLGCGTGLAGVALSDLLHGPLTGVDLSRRMLEQAAAKGIYARLRQADLAAVLREAGEAYALIIAADVFCYLGDLRRPWRSAGSAWRRAACCCSAWNAARHATRRGRDGGWDRPAVTPMRRTTSPPAWPRPGCRRWNAGRKCCAATARRPSPACWWRRMRPATEGSLWPAGLAALAGGAPAAAVPLLAEATAAGEGGGLAPLNLGLALMQLGRLAEAVPALEGGGAGAAGSCRAALPPRHHRRPAWRGGAGGDAVPGCPGARSAARAGAGRAGGAG